MEQNQTLSCKERLIFEALILHGGQVQITWTSVVEAIP